MSDKKERRREFYKTPDFTTLNAAGDAKVEINKKQKPSKDGTPVEDVKTKEVLAKADAFEKGNFKDIRKAINLSDNPAQQQRLQNKLNKLELKKGFKASELKAKGEKQIARMKYGRKGAEAGMAKEASDKAATDLYQTEKKKQLKTVPIVAKRNESSKQNSVNQKLQGVAQNIPFKDEEGNPLKKIQRRSFRDSSGIGDDRMGVFREGTGQYNYLGEKDNIFGSVNPDVGLGDKWDSKINLWRTSFPFSPTMDKIPEKQIQQDYEKYKKASEIGESKRAARDEQASNLAKIRGAVGYEKKKLEELSKLKTRKLK